MKTLLSGIAYVAFIILLFSCDSKERKRLENQVKALNVELNSTNEVMSQMAEVNVLIDSIDASREILRHGAIESTSNNSYAGRLKEINQYVKDTERKIMELEKRTKDMSAISDAFYRLKTSFALSAKKVATLQTEIDSIRGQHKIMKLALVRKDSLLNLSEDLIKASAANIVAIERTLKDTEEKNKLEMAELYFKQANTFEVVAARTNFAPRKRKLALRNAIELYKISLSLGKEEAQQKIDDLILKLS